MAKTVIRVEKISKKYRLGLIGGHSLREDWQRLWAKVRGKSDPTLPVCISGDVLRECGGQIWALRDVSFEVAEGEVLGVVGGNGAGKSTLLKILTRITAPTSGRALMKGRVGALLEVGTGFHPELTGKENVFLSGAILGMTKAEINKKLEEIVEFSGCERYIDTPVKRYSSGMQVRLAFAVAAHLEPEILLIDEVLAVGDAQFQKKCLGKMGDISRQGRTVLFVSHNMAAVQKLCDRAILIRNGSLVCEGRTAEVIAEYLKNCEDNQTCAVEFEIDDKLDLSFAKIEIVNLNSDNSAMIDVNDELEVRITYKIHRKVDNCHLTLIVKKSDTPLFATYDTDLAQDLSGSRSPGVYMARVKLPRKLLKAGTYTLWLNSYRNGVGRIDRKGDVLSFHISEIRETFSGKSYSAGCPGTLIVPLKWETERME